MKTTSTSHNISLRLNCDVTTYHLKEHYIPYLHSFRVLKLTGEGVGSVLSFDRGTLDLGATLPGSPGIEGTVTLTSVCDEAVEVFSLDFDTEYLVEEEVLSTANVYGMHGIYRAGVRMAGEGLPGPVLASYKRVICEREKKEEKEREKERKRIDDNVDSLTTDTPTTTITNFNFNMDSSSDESDLFFTTPPIRVFPAPRDEGKHQDIVVAGPPLIGCTSIADKLGKKLQLPVRNIDTIIQELAGTDGEYGILARRCLGLSTSYELIDRRKEIDNALQCSVNSQRVVLESAKKERKKAKDPVPEIPVTPESLSYSVLLKDDTLNTDNLARLITSRLSWSDAGQGIILDGLQSAYMKSADVAKAVASTYGIYSCLKFDLFQSK